MNNLRLTFTLFSLIFLLTSNAFSQNDKQIKKDLVNTWYAVTVGEPEGGEMAPTSRKEALTFNADGSMIIKDGDMEIEGKWEYLGDLKIKSGFSFKGIEREAELTIREVSEDKLVLISPNVATGYSTTPPDPNAPKPREAPTVVNSVSTIEVDKWTGVHPFNKKVITTINGKQEQVDAVGVIVLLMINGKKTLRINDDGLTTDIEVSEGEEIVGEMHFGLVTDDPEMAGEVIFKEDGSPFLYRDKDQSTIEYIKE